MSKGKKRAMVIFLVECMIIISGFSIVQSKNNVPHEEMETQKNITVSQVFSSPTITIEKDYCLIHLKGENTKLTTAGKPLLPVFSQTLEFPMGTRIINVNCTYSPVHEMHLIKTVKPAGKPYVTWRIRNVFQKEKDEDVYTRNRFFPGSFYTMKQLGGLNREHKPTFFLTIQFYPVQYNPVTNVIQSTRSITLNITVEEPIKPLMFPDEYNLLILSDDTFSSLLTPLVIHKNNHGVITKLVTLSEVYDGTYFPVKGRDNPEKIKYFIKNAREQWGIQYVMLVGNYKKIPVRYTHLETDTGGLYEELFFVSDLYYMDLYTANGSFSSWDTDNDGIYGEWPYPIGTSMEDAVDMTPDVYVGRLACMNRFEVRTMVEKIIDYEEHTYDRDWFKRMIVVGGDTFDKIWEQGTDYNEGEIANEKALEYMQGFIPIRLWASLYNLTTENIQQEISKGAGFTYFVGHGNPRHWATHYNGDYHNWTEGLYNRDMFQFSNKGMYPILMVGGCHNSQIDVTPLNFIKGILTEGFHYFSGDPDDFGSYWTSNWVPECWSWFFVKIRNGGAIASMGSTGYGGVNIGDYDKNGIPDCVEGADGWFETHFFQLYNEEHIDVLGETYGQTVTDYVNMFPVYSNRYDAKIVQTHILLGDPSLKIGGYPKKG